MISIDKFEKYKKHPLETLEELSFRNLVICQDMNLTIEFIKILIDIEKTKKDSACDDQSKSTVKRDDIQNTSQKLV